ncbi:MAG: DUF2800 domain-containing protein [Clostridiales bacterium]|nr:DUF2800 domain-containing protein [Clostridiales bacterium]
MPKHALLSASSAHRWMACPPSARMCEDAEEQHSEYAAQGTDAHSLCEMKLRQAIGQRAKVDVSDLTYYDMAMEDAAEEYRDFIVGKFEAAKQECRDPLLLIEERLDFSRWVPEGFGTGDAVILADKVLYVIDFKYGTGVRVEAEGNPQMRCYALGALDAFDGIYDIESVEMTIFQPRLGNVSTSFMAKDDLLKWSDEVLAPTAKLAFDGKCEFKAGGHCRFCRVKATCRARAEHSMELARYDFAEPATLSDEEIAEILPRIDELTAWAADVKDFALAQALAGVHYDGFKLVEGRSIRKYVSEEAVADAVSAAGYDPYEQKVLGITAMTSLLGKRKFEEILGDLVHKPPGKPVLVPETDRRPAMNTAADDFNGIND